MPLNYKVPVHRGANVIAANPQRLTSKDNEKWACGRNVKRSLGNHRFDSVEVWTLKYRENGKAKVAATNRDRKAAEDWVNS